MRTLFQKIENNQYLPVGTPGHGFNGYINTIIGDGSQYLGNPQDMAVFSVMMKQLGLDPMNNKTWLTGDANFLGANRDKTNSMYGFPYHANKTWGRSSIRTRILDTVSRGYPLKLQLNSLASKILYDPSCSSPSAYGVEFLTGQSIYQADPRYNGTKGVTNRAYARKEVIVAGGVFSTPQLMKLSGLGPAAELKKFNIPVVVDLPGVGFNMMDNQEIGVFGLAQQSFWPGPNPCSPNAPNDPCYAQWQQGQGPYTQPGPNTNLVIMTSNHSTDGERDLNVFAGPYEFHGFFPATPNQSWGEPPNTWGMHTVKFHNQNNNGYVKLRSADPTDVPEILFNYYTKGVDIDLGAQKDAVKWARRALLSVPAPVGPFNITIPPCPTGVLPDGSCSDPNADEQWIRDNTFGHHATGTCAMGPLSDANTVVDSQFRVKGVDNLRIVDGSIFPKSPGSFPVISTYMIAEKASVNILADA
jgi:choline dehydrogenase